jgi:hypothetical protein
MFSEVLFLDLVLEPVRILEQVLQHDRRLRIGPMASLLSLRELTFEAMDAEFEVCGGGGHAGEGIVEVVATAAILETRSSSRTGPSHPNTLARSFIQLSHPFLIQCHLLCLFPPLLLRLDQLFPRPFEIELEAVHLALQRGRLGLERVDFGFVRVEEGLVRCGFGVVVFESGVPIQQVGILLFEGLWDKYMTKNDQLGSRLTSVVTCTPTLSTVGCPTLSILLVSAASSSFFLYFSITFSCFLARSLVCRYSST